MSMCAKFDSTPDAAWADINAASVKSRVGHLSAFFTKAKRSIQDYCAFRRAKAELLKLDCRALKDIGLDRSEIESVLTDYGHERRNGVRPLSPSPASVPANR
jgi:uncharacterized protein YjiS (DUF1127 family)